MPSSSAAFSFCLALALALASGACVDHTQRGAAPGAADSRPSSRASGGATSRPSKRETEAERNARLLAQHGSDGAKEVVEARGVLPDWGDYEKLLARAVSGDRVDYALVRRERATVEKALAAVAKLDLAKVDKVGQLATIVNTYNAATLLLVLDHVLGRGQDGSDLAGVLEVEKAGGIRFFDSEQVVFAGESLSLNALEAKGRALGDPRIHFAVNCASVSCPPLLARAWRAETLEADLASATRAYLASPAGLQLRDGKLAVSKIFEWYAKDWGGVEGVKNFLLLYAPDAAKEAVHRGLDYLEYDWRLNAVR